MAQENQEQDKSQSATPYKLEEARKRGQVSKSIELTSAFVLAACVTVLYVSGETLLVRLIRAFRFFFSQAHQITFDLAFARAVEGVIVRQLLDLLWPLLAAVISFSVVINILQSGPIFSFFPLKPDLSRINPVSGFKRIFSRRSAVELLKNLLKITVITGIMASVFLAIKPGFIGLTSSDARGVFGFAANEGIRVLFMLTMALCFLALIDFVYSRWDFAQRMRMSNREVKEEHKRREGDPRIKAKIRQLRKERIKRSASIARTSGADVVITNPTHFAVALRYDRENMAVPSIWAKGSGDAALKIRRIAASKGIPVIENPRLARKLFWSADVDQPIPEEFFTVVARVFVWVYSLKNKERNVAK